jgi:hypothetical protein
MPPSTVIVFGLRKPNAATAIASARDVPLKWLEVKALQQRLVEVIRDDRSGVRGEPLSRIAVIQVRPCAIVRERPAAHDPPKRAEVAAQLDELPWAEGPAGRKRERVAVVHAPGLPVPDDRRARARGPPRGSQTELGDETGDVRVGRREELGAPIDDEPVDGLGAHAPADLVPRLENGDRRARLREPVGGDQAREPGPDDDDLRPQRHPASLWCGPALGSNSSRTNPGVRDPGPGSGNKCPERGLVGVALSPQAGSQSRMIFT